MLEQENRRLSKVNEVVKRDIGQVSGLKGLLGNLEAKHEQLRATVARHDGELAETRRRNSELGVRAQQLEGENRRLPDSSKGLKSQLKEPHEAGKQNAVAHLQEAITAGTSKVNQGITSLEREFAKANEEMRSTKPKAEPLTPPVTDVAGPPTSAPPPTQPRLREWPRHRRPAPGNHRPNHQQTCHHRDPLIYPRNLPQWDRITEERFRRQNNQLFRLPRGQPASAEVFEQQFTTPKRNSTAQTGKSVPSVGEERDAWI
jgi:hypothetical protein